VSSLNGFGAVLAIGAHCQYVRTRPEVTVSIHIMIFSVCIRVFLFLSPEIQLVGTYTPPLSILRLEK
jgi:hypothetical protein